MKAKTKKAAPPKGRSAKSSRRGKSAGENAVAMLKADHKKVSGMFAKYEKLKSADQKSTLAHEICKELIVHTELEEQIFYPACRKAGVEEDMMDEAQVEHDGAKVMIIELLGKPAGDDYYDAKVKVLSEYIKHHVKEEEQPGKGVFAKANKAGVDMADTGARMKEMKAGLVAKYDPDNLPAPDFRSFHEAFKANVGKPDPIEDLTVKGEPRPWSKVQHAAR
jgi:hypothetical protein